MSTSRKQTTTPLSWQSEVEVLYSREQIHERVLAIGKQITEDYRGKKLTVVCVLRGAFPFFADLVRAIDLPLLCEFITLSSYGDATRSSGTVALKSELPQSISDHDVLVVEDIVDTGLSMTALLGHLEALGPRSVGVATLLDKPDHRAQPVPIAYRGFVIPNAFVIGYGLDFRGYFRNLPYVGVYRGPT